jgi:hypothetical protein
MIKFPNVSVRLVGNDGNAFAILGTVKKAMTRAKISQEDIKKFMDDATSGDYDHLLRVVMETVEVQ